jgi:sugar/nucleoside kinase (ribokinase family)
VVSAAGIEVVPVPEVERIVDTTGAGDLFAAGFLVGLARDLPLAACATLGHIAAGEVIGHVGPRPQVPLAELAAKAGIAIG